MNIFVTSLISHFFDLFDHLNKSNNNPLNYYINIPRKFNEDIINSIISQIYTYSSVIDLNKLIPKFEIEEIHEVLDYFQIKCVALNYDEVDKKKDISCLYEDINYLKCSKRKVEAKKMINLKMLYISGNIKIRKFPSSLEILYANYCPHLTNECLKNLTNLTELYMRYNKLIYKFPPSLKVLHIAKCKRIRSNSLENLNNLIELLMEYDGTIDTLPSSLERLHIYSCYGLTNLSIEKLPNLKLLNMLGCYDITKIPSHVKLYDGCYENFIVDDPSIIRFN